MVVEGGRREWLITHLSLGRDQILSKFLIHKIILKIENIFYAFLI